MTEKYSSTEHGGSLGRSSSNETQTNCERKREIDCQENGNQNPGRASHSRSEGYSTKRTQSESESIVKNTGPNGTYGMSETEKSRTERRQNEENGETQPTDSFNQLINFDAARSVSMNLLDETATHCLEYMKSIGRDCDREPQLRDFRKINAVANLATQVANLAKVKLDAIKEARKVSVRA
jgi:hypothetical protein